MVSILGKVLKAIPFIGVLLVFAGVVLSVMNRQMDTLSMALIFIGFILLLGMFLRVEPASLRYYTNLGISGSLLLAILVVVYLLVQSHDYQWDLTKNGRYSLSPQTKRIVSGLKKRVDISIMATSNEPYYGYLKQYSALSDNLKFKISNPYQDISLRKGPEGELKVNDVIIRSGKKERRSSSMRRWISVNWKKSLPTAF